MKRLFLFLCLVGVCHAQAPTYIVTVRVSGGAVTVDKIETVTPTPTATPIATTPTPTATPTAVTIGWSPYPNATNYRVYYGTTSKSYNTNVVVGNVTRYKLTLPTAAKYYIVTKPMKADGTEITTSNELSTP